MKFTNIRKFILIYIFPIIFAFFSRLGLFLVRMVKSAYFWLIASGAVAEYAFVLVRMVKTFDGCVAFVTFQAFFAFIPACSFNKSFTVFGQVLEQLRWPSEVTSVMRIDAAFGVVGVFIVGTPACLVFKHIEGENFDLLVYLVQFDVKIRKVYKAIWHKVVFNTWNILKFLKCLLLFWKFRFIVRMLERSSFVKLTK